MNKFKTRGLCAAVVAGVFGVLAAAPAVAAEQPSRVIVKFKAGAFAKGTAEVAKQGGRVLVDLAEVSAIATRLSPKAIAALKRSKNVEFIEVDHPQVAYARVAPRNLVLAVGGSEVVPYGIPMVQADQVSDAAAGNRKLCIIDSGIDAAHPDFGGVSLTGENLTTSGTWDTDENGHGTHVAGTIGARGGNGIGVVGVNPSGTLPLHILKVFDATGSTSSSTVAKAMLACRKAGANVVSMSLGGSSPSRLQEFVVRLLAGRNVLLIAAAGNAGTSDVSYPAGFPEVVSVAAIDSAKARAPFSQFNPDVEIAAPGVGVLSTVPQGTGLSATLTAGTSGYPAQPVDGSPVASATGPLADFGFGGTATPGSMTGKVCVVSRGNNVTFADKVLNCQASGGVAAVIYNNVAGELFATLGGAVTTIPSIGVTQATGGALLGQLGVSATVAISGSDYAELSGTSMATPHVAGVAALVWSQHTNCTAAQLRASLNNSAMDLGTAGRDDDFGFGLVQAKAATDRIAALGCGN
jgi:subtilisin family serine protease